MNDDMLRFQRSWTRKPQTMFTETLNPDGQIHIPNRHQGAHLIME